MTTDGPWKFSQSIPSDTSIGSGLVSQLLEAMMERDWPPADLFRTQLAYEEAIVNAIRHGNRCDLDKKVLVEMTCGDEEVWIQITDEGKGFDPQSIPDPRQDDLLEVPGGRGCLLIHEIMSSVTYNETGNQITMVKIKGDSPPMDDDDDE
ncbi:ATP-binding protein [Stieleria varia]|uniref:Anti-sigma F factor n=1 Tax=Stieleria varia TaxID=2528005 RepID=A0A5C5ZM09_9BACT|nr:ATP-binding protein [Stieleria varia]TWT87871.1 anti-sigma F factor [Stieleria varia]